MHSESIQFSVLGTHQNPVELWDTFKCKSLKAAKEGTGENSKSRSGSVSILALRVLMECELVSPGMLAAYANLKGAFDSVHHEALWDLLQLF